MQVSSQQSVHPVIERKSSVLVVDDDPTYRRVFTRLLECAGFEVSQASDGEEAIALLEETPHNVVLLDVVMPRLDGMATLAHLQRVIMQHPTLVILVTAQGQVSQAVDAMKQGAFDFIEKPVAPDLLIGRVRNAVQKWSFLNRRVRALNDFRAMVDSLSNREREVCAELVSGLHTKCIARHLGISPKTVEFHRSRILTKIQVSSVLDLVAQAAQFPEVDLRNLDRERLSHSADHEVVC